MEPKGVLFDLDMTLVDSSRLSEYREKQDWVGALARMGEIRPFIPKVGPPPHELPARFKARGVSVAVVTSSPEPYAKAVLAQFRIVHDVLISSKDTGSFKPLPEPFKLAMERLGIAPGDCLSIGDDAIDAEAAHLAGVTSVGALWRYANLGDPHLKAFWTSSPDIAVLYPSVILLPGFLESCRYVGEAVISGVPWQKQEGFRLYWQEVTGERFECLGRYFVSGDLRSASAPWTRRILDLKDDPSISDEFSRAIAEFLSHYPWKPGVLVPVPPKPGETSRFSAMLAALPPLLSMASTQVSDGLVCLRPVPEYKGMDHRARELAIRGTIGINRSFAGQRVMVLDDVLTSGATARECARVLRHAGAAEVRILALGLTQKRFYRKVCPSCGRSMCIRTNSKDGSRFWGCSGYKRRECTRTVPLSPGELPQ